MFTKHGLKTHLLGSLEIALLMPVARTRFGNTAEEALKSFFVPLFLLPISMLAIYAFPPPELADDTANAIAVLYTFRLAISWGLFFGAIYWISGQIDRREHFFQFVIANNWLAVPATAIFIPVWWMLFNGSYSWAELAPFMSCLIIYTYGCTAFVANRILRIPWELACFIAFIGYSINDNTLDILHWIGAII